MNNRISIQQAIDYIENNLTKDISVLHIATHIGYSYYHFNRLFQAVTDLSPKDYLLKRRLSEGAKEILENKKRLTDIAFTYHFNDYETFSRAFKRTFGFSPKTFQKQHQNIQITLLSRITEKDIIHLEKIKGIEPEVVELDGIHIVGLTTLVRGSTSIITELWSQMNQEIHHVEGIRKPHRFYEVHYWTENNDLDGFFVMCAVETSDITKINTTLNAKIIPRARYLKFIHKGMSRNVGLTYKYIFQTWLPKSNYKLHLPYEFEFYGNDYLGPDNEDSISEIYIPIEILD